MILKFYLIVYYCNRKRYQGLSLYLTKLNIASQARFVIIYFFLKYDNELTAKLATVLLVIFLSFVTIVSVVSNKKFQNFAQLCLYNRISKSVPMNFLDLERSQNPDVSY